ncbi:XapX domain protein [Burkholderia cenocepacia]|uniref:DUF1427 family protein n=1 Tax=Burkholderia cenocepacia TaxID=95486 RepID=UPI000980CB21|nr:DUF1427 family protein [Burkholderia cenocepacia]MDC6083108.1 DUF1427 family protein [Burkholderia cenocepacia]ONY15354.1 XapX domain protein [Burkholderia cenocepacia]ONZ10365.1 XapX domain protein [Burkholderia cenocepacia]ONZ10740.1 XapX domain protein [Burkholderia cenocepacia]ONZ14000.1 XapX domain protein [Burkholderia cenocepacia]
MEPYLVSLGAGVLIGVIYSAIKVRSPAPPLIALVGLLGMLIGVQALPPRETTLWLLINKR